MNAVRTTITVPVTWAARVAVRANERYPVYLVQGEHHGTCRKQTPETQGNINKYDAMLWPEDIVASTHQNYVCWAAQARKQRGLGS